MAVLDFQSLYPSIMISHNYCYSTCLGDIDEVWNYAGKRLGMVKDYRANYDFLGISPSEDDINAKVFVAPNRVAYLRSSVRQGVIPKLLDEFLQTRIMFKQSAKLYKDNRRIQRILDFRQMALKLFMNVTYGYTAASCTGRMPCSDIADSIVGTGRHILEKAIKMIDGMDGLKVIYGDTGMIR